MLVWINLCFGILDSYYRFDMSVEEAIELGIRLISDYYV